MADTARTKRPFADRLWGRMASSPLNVRIVSLVFVMVAIVSMSYCQLGFWLCGAIDGKQVYLMLLLGPLIMGAVIFGPITGALLGLFAGGVVFAHAVLFPLDYYELYFMTPLNTFVLLTFIGAVSGLLFSRVLRKNPQGGVRAVRIVAVSIVVSLAASLLVQLNTVIMYSGVASFDLIREFLLTSPLGILVQALIDAVLIAFLCIVADMSARRSASQGGDRELLALFSGWMLMISVIVFMATSAIIFSIATIQAGNDAEQAMLSEVDYLERQLDSNENADTDSLLDGYSQSIDGDIVIMDKKGTILASDCSDGKYEKGESFLKVIGYGEYIEDSSKEGSEAGEEDEGVTLATLFLQDLASTHEVQMLQAYEVGGPISMDITFMAVASYDRGFVAMLRSSDMVYATRFSIMFAATVLAIVLIVSIAFVAARLLKTVVVRRIDETNDSLHKITEGDLNERVRVRDSREFASLSQGINTTVAALKESISEAEQKNAQELITAKAIQESTLPREFPPFPEIDKFDIYASMKTAKEVGGDFYDFFLIGDGKLGFIMADVSGKGIPAALFMMTAKTQIKNYMEAGLPINEAVDAANYQLCLGNDAGMFVTMFACVLNYETGELSYVNAGHNPPLLLRDGNWEWMTDVSGMPLGLFDGIPYDGFKRQLEPEDMLYLYTDGVTEAMDADGNMFGEDRLEQTLYSYATFNPRSVGVGVRRAITDFTLDCEQSDDITMLILKYGVPPEKKAVMVLPAVDTQLVHVYNFIHEELKRRNAPNSVRNPLDIAAEELFVNVCHYAYPDATPENPGEVRIGFEYESNPPSLTVTISDDGIPYNPLAKPDAVTPDDIMDVPIGGLGILMAKKSVDDMSYERVGDSNVVTFCKGW